MIKSKYFNIETDINYIDHLSKENIQQINEFFKNKIIINLLKTNGFDNLYKEWNTLTDLEPGILTEILIQANVDFLSYMHTLPTFWLKSHSDKVYTSITVPSNINHYSWMCFNDANIKKILFEQTEDPTFNSDIFFKDLNKTDNKIYFGICNYTELIKLDRI